MKGTNLGELEEVVLLIVAALSPKAYGFAVKENLDERTGRYANLSAIHACLYRLEKKGFLESEFGEATKKRGGKSKKYFSLTSEGMAAIVEAKKIRNNLWDEISLSVIKAT